MSTRRFSVLSSRVFHRVSSGPKTGYDWSEMGFFAARPLGVTAHGGPTGPLQVDRLEAALAAKYPALMFAPLRDRFAN